MIIKCAFYSSTVLTQEAKITVKGGILSSYLEGLMALSMTGYAKKVIKLFL